MSKTFLKSMAVAMALVPFAAAPVAAQVAKPPMSYQGQWWTNPTGCTYSRAGRPGETMWFLIVNTAKPGCPTYITGNTWGNVYAPNAPRIGD